MKVVTLDGKSRAERLVGEIQELPPTVRGALLRRKSRRERLTAEVKDLSPAGRIALAAAATAVLIGVAYLVRKRLFVAVAVVADAVEEVADTVEDAAEDLSEAARERASASASD